MSVLVTKNNNDRGINKRYNYEPTSIVVIILTIICILGCSYLMFKVAMNLYKGCQDGNMMACFALFSR